MSDKPNEQDPLQTAAKHNAADDALERSSRFFTTLAQISPVGIFRTDAQGNCTFVNERWCKIVGITPAKALGGGWAQAIHPGDREKVAQAWYTSTQAHHNFIMEYRIQRPSGTTRWVLGQAADERNTEDELVGYVGTITDITQSKQAEEEFQRFFNLIPDLACIASTNGYFLRINPMWQETLGYTEQEILAKPFLDLIHPDDRDATIKEVERQLAGEPTMQFTNRYRCKDGSYRWLEWRATPAVDGKLLFASARDITERKRAEEAMLEALDRFQKITQLVPGIVYQFRLRPDGSTCVPYASEATREIYRLNPEEIREDASKAFVHVHPDDLENLMVSIQTSARDLTPWQHEYRLKFDDGTVRWLFGNGLPQREADGSTLWHGFITDITERKQAEEMLRFHSSILQNLAEGVFLIRASDGAIVFANPQFERMFGYEPDELLGKHVSIVNAPGEKNPEAVAAAIMAELARTGMWNGEVQNIRKDGTAFWCHASVSTFEHPQFGKVWVSVHEDITERKRATAEILAARNQLQATLDASPDLMFELGLDGTYYDYHSPHTDLLAAPAEEMLGKKVPDILPPGAANVVMSALQEAHEKGRSSGKQFELKLPKGNLWFELSVSRKPADPGQGPRFIVMSRDITGRKQTEEQIRHLAFYDSLTLLPNRRLLNNRLEQTMASSKRSGRYGALMFLDLDNFKPLNDKYGHNAGDLLLIEVACRIVSCVREMDTVARFGGDEFMVMLSELDDDNTESAAQAGIVAEKIRTTLAKPYVLKIQHEGKAETTVEHHCTSSIGVVLFIGHQGSAEDIVKWADLAMYQAKNAGRNLIRFYA